MDATDPANIPTWPPHFGYVRSTLEFSGITHIICLYPSLTEKWQRFKRRGKNLKKTRINNTNSYYPLLILPGVTHHNTIIAIGCRTPFCSGEAVTTRFLARTRPAKWQARGLMNRAADNNKQSSRTSRALYSRAAAEAITHDNIPII